VEAILGNDLRGPSAGFQGRVPRRYAEPDKGFVDRSDAWWSAPYWDIDPGFASRLVLLTAVDHGLGA
jgi:hypothetical protein